MEINHVLNCTLSSKFTSLEGFWLGIIFFELSERHLYPFNLAPLFRLRHHIWCQIWMWFWVRINLNFELCIAILTKLDPLFSIVALDLNHVTIKLGARALRWSRFIQIFVFLLILFKLCWKCWYCGDRMSFFRVLTEWILVHSIRRNFFVFVAFCECTKKQSASQRSVSNPPVTWRRMSPGWGEMALATELWKLSIMDQWDGPR